MNPNSIKQIFNIKAKIFTEKDELIIQDTSMYLKSFKAAIMDVVLSSSSEVVGEKG